MFLFAQSNANQIKIFLLCIFVDVVCTFYNELNVKNEQLKCTNEKKILIRHKDIMPKERKTICIIKIKLNKTRHDTVVQ